MLTSEFEIKEETPPSTRHLKHLKGDYRIAICQDGKFAATFDTANFRIKILENTDHRPFDDYSSKHNKFDKDDINTNNSLSNKPDRSELNKSVAHFKISGDFTINKFYEIAGIENDDVRDSSSSLSNDNVTAENEDNFRWSFDISNLRERGGKYFILVAISRMNVEEDLKGTKEGENKNDYVRGYLAKNIKDKYEETKLGYVTVNISNPKKGIIEDIRDSFEKPESKMSQSGKGVAIYCLKLEQKEGIYVLSDRDVGFFYSGSASGICKFINIEKSENHVEQEKFIILNFHGIYNFELNLSATKGISSNLNEKLEYPKSFRRELDNWYLGHAKNDCMKQLLSCIYDKYFTLQKP